MRRSDISGLVSPVSSSTKMRLASGLSRSLSSISRFDWRSSRIASGCRNELV